MGNQGAFEVVTKHLSKQELKEDKVAVAAAEAADYLKEHARVLGAAIAVVVVAIVVVVVVIQTRERADREAAAAMFTAESAYFSGDYAGAASQFQAVADKHGAAKMAKQARLFEGNAELAAGNAAAAEKSFRSFLSGRTADPIFETAARRGLGGALVSQEKPADGAEQYAQAAKIAGNALAAEDWLSAGRAYAAAGNQAQAIQSYRSAIEASPAGAATAEARVRLQEALAR